MYMYTCILHIYIYIYGHQLEPEGDVDIGLWAKDRIHFALRGNGG